jgi:hypothetical protein
MRERITLNRKEQTRTKVITMVLEGRCTQSGLRVKQIAPNWKTVLPPAAERTWCPFVRERLGSPREVLWRPGRLRAEACLFALAEGSRGTPRALRRAMARSMLLGSRPSASVTDGKLFQELGEGQPELGPLSVSTQRGGRTMTSGSLSLKGGSRAPTASRPIPRIVASYL